MDTSTAAARGLHLSIPRMEWRVVSSDHSSRSSTSEGRELVDADFYSIITDESLDYDNSQQHLYTISRQREDLQRLQIELRARIVARSGLMEMQKNFDNQFQEHANAFAKLQEQLHQKEQIIHELEQRIEGKDSELHAVKLENESARAKEDLLRQQNKELQNYRREHDNSEAEKSQLVKQIHGLQEHIQDREEQLLELREQHRVAQEAIVYKDEQLREAQAWITRIQEMDAGQSTSTYSLQAELRERNEQYNQLWISCQYQFAEMERLHLYTVQQFQLELANAKERIGASVDEAQVSQTKANDSSQLQKDAKKSEANGSVISTRNSGLVLNGNVDNLPPNVSTGNASTKVDHVHGVAIAPPTLLGMSSHVPHAPVASVYPFVMHQQGYPYSAPGLVSQSHLGQFQTMPAALVLQNWQNQQASSEVSLSPTVSQYPPSQTFDHEAPIDGQAVHPEHSGVHSRQGSESTTVKLPSAEVIKASLASPPSQESLQNVSSQSDDAVQLDALPQKSETEDKTISNLPDHVLKSQGSISEETCPPADSASFKAVPRASINVASGTSGSAMVSSEALISSGQKIMLSSGQSSETALLDERLLLACVVRTMPPGIGGKIRISSMLPNRLGKMLAPLHWHDYKRKYGKLDDFVAGYPELFLIEGDYIQLREGAQETIAARAAVAKVAAAAKSVSCHYSSMFPSVAVTPMAQSYRLKRDHSIESKNSNDSVHDQFANGNSSIKIFSKPIDKKVLNGSENGHGHSSGATATNFQKPGFSNFSSKGSSHRSYVTDSGKAPG